jgi:integrase
MRKPFWVKNKKCWYVKDSSGKFLRLDPDEEKAYGMWRDMSANADRLFDPKVSLASLVESWLSQSESQVTQDRHRRISVNLTGFLKHIGIRASAINVTPKHVMEWVNSQATPSGKPWSAATRRDAVSNLKRVYAWAHNEGHIPRNPLASIRMKKARPRQRTISEWEHVWLVVRARRQKRNGKQFALYLIASHCGARPQQIRDVTADHVHQSGKSWVFREHKTAELTGKHLTVHLSPCLQTITKILAASRSSRSSRLFCQENGLPWKKDTVCRRLRRMRDELGLDSGVIAYAYRHTFATNALLAGVPIATVAALLGHQNSRMVSEVYGHLSQHDEHLGNAAAIVQASRLAGTCLISETTNEDSRKSRP